MSIEASPPAQPPQVSPDGKWIWDGNEWRPFAVHDAIFPNWKSVGAGFAPEVAPPAQPVPAPAPRKKQAPAPAYRMAAPPPTMDVPLWKKEGPSTGIQKYLYIAAGGIALVIAAVVLRSLVLIPLSEPQGTAAQPTASPTPALSVRSDSARADRFVNGLLATPMADLKDDLAQLKATCSVGMTSSCEDSLISTSSAVAVMKTVIDGETVPVCIAGQKAKLSSDVTKLDSGIQLALKGFKDNKKAEVTGGVSQVKSAGALVQTDFAGLSNAAKGCDTQLVGP